MITQNNVVRPATTMEIRGLTVSRPSAACIASGRQTIDPRSWRTGYRGLLAIRSSAGPFDEAALFSGAVLEALSMAPGQAFHRGAIVATARLAGCHPQSPDCDSAWCEAAAPWHWELADIHPLAHPLFCKGGPGLWRPPPGLRERLRSHIEAVSSALPVPDARRETTPFNSREGKR